MSSRTITLKILITDAIAEDGGYVTTASVEELNLKKSGRFRPESIPEGTVTGAVAAMEAGTLDAEETEAFGRTLYKALICGDIERVYEAAKRAGRIRLRLTADPRRAQVIPWELMHDGNHFLAVAGPLARGISSVVPAEPPTATLPLRVLAVNGFPEAEKSRGDAELGSIVSALESLSDDLAVVTYLSRASLDELQETLRAAAAEPKPQPFHVLHFIGHGRLGKKVGKEPRSNVLVFEDKEVTPEALVEIIDEYDLKLVFLNSCDSLEIPAQEAARTFAPVLLGSGIPALIGMQTIVFEAAARTFAGEFYEALAANRAVDEAITDARQIAKASEPDYVYDVGVPVCYLRSESGRILDLQPSPEPASWWRRRLTALADNMVATIVWALAIALVGFLVNAWRGPDRMNELTFNAAVAEFAAVDGADSQTAKDLSIRLSEQLENALTELDFTDVWGPDQAGRITGDTQEIRAAQAEELADRINADVLVYGAVSGESFGGEFIPEFFVNDRQLSGASELTGTYALGDGDPFDTSLDAIDELRDRLAGRANGLAQFVIGLSAYSRAAYDRALPRLQHALETDGWANEDGKEVVWLFLGNTYGRLFDYPAAGDAFEQALVIEPGYARAMIGRADITFQKSRGGCTPPADPAGLEVAEAQFREALAAPDPPPLADIEVKATYGIGRVYMCQQIGGIASDPAIPMFENVIETYHSRDATTQRRLEELASEAHANLGVLFATLAPQDLDRAISEYEMGIDLAPDKERQAVFLGNQADAYRQAKDCEAAAAALDRALSLTDTESVKELLIGQKESLSC